jgi:hypothetical protein
MGHGVSNTSKRHGLIYILSRPNNFSPGCTQFLTTILDRLW